MLLEKKQDEDRSDAIFSVVKERLHDYADTFGELSRSFDREFQYEGEDRQGILDARRNWENRLLMGNNLAQIGRIIEGIAGEMFDIRKIPAHKRKHLEQYLRGEGICLEDICLVRTLGREDTYCAYLRTRSQKEVPAGRLEKVFSTVFSSPYQLSAASPEYIRSKPKLFRFVQKTKYVAFTGYARVIKEGEIVSGDTYSFWNSEKGKITAILADGTGSGEKASSESAEVLERMERMLEAGIGVEEAVNLLNGSYFACGEDWNHPTLDICEIDLYSGEAVFLKIGGSASFIRRENGVDVVQGGMLPVGLFQDMHHISQNRSMKNGDYVVMVSDGVVDAFSGEKYEEAIGNLLSNLPEDHPEVLAEELLRLAICAKSGHIRDDMTVLVIGIWEKNNR